MYRTVDGLPDSEGCERLLRTICRQKCNERLFGTDCECYAEGFIPELGLEFAHMLQQC